MNLFRQAPPDSPLPSCQTARSQSAHPWVPEGGLGKMLDAISGRSISPSPSAHSCSSACMIEEDGHTHHPHPLREHPPSVYDDDYQDILLAPPAALTFPLSPCYSPEPPSPAEGVPTSPQHRSLAATFFDKVKVPPILTQRASRASLNSPTKSFSSLISRSTTTENTSRSPTRKQQAPLFSDWFTGESAPVSLGPIPSPNRDLHRHGRHGSCDSDVDEDDEDDDYFSPEMVDPVYTARPTRSRGNSTAAAQNQTTGTSLASKLSWFTKSASPPQPRPPTNAPLDLSDDLLTLNISAALLPHGTPDILAPSSFNDLLSISEALVTRYQTAYRNQAAAISDFKREKDAQAEELEEAETRARHLKMQLDGMAERARAQEDAMRALKLELLAERRRREDEEAARQRSVQIVRARDGKVGGRARTGSNVSASDSGFESDADSAASETAGSSTSTSSRTLADEHLSQVSSEKARPPIQTRMSTYDHVLRGTAGDPASSWAVMEGFREENRLLRDRVRELEGAVEGCLDLVAGIGV